MKLFLIIILAFILIQSTYQQSCTNKDEFYSTAQASCLSKYQIFQNSINLQILIFSECKDAIYGCSSCSEVVVTNSTLSTQRFVTCQSCSDGLFLMSNKTNSQNYPDSLTYCVADCNKAHQAFVSDPTTGNCKYCGEYCSSCNFQYGCESCQGESQNKGWVSAQTLDTSISFSSTFKQCKSRFSFTTYATTNLCTQSKVHALGYTYCTQCRDGYYLKSGVLYDLTYKVYLPACQAYTGSGQCMEPSSVTTCEICQYNYDEITVLGSLVCGNCQTINTFYPDAVRCNQTIINVPSVIRACRDGYINNATGQCVSKCPVGQYGLAIFNRRGTVESTFCAACNATCYECNNGSGECSSCKKGYFLDTGSTRRKSTGTCKIKSTSQLTTNIYVNAYDMPQNNNPVDTITGTSLTNSFNTISDAIRKAQESAAQYEVFQAKIFLKPGTHAMLRNSNTPQYMPRYYDQYSAGLILILDSQDGSQITVQYKMKDDWTFKVGRSLTVNNIIFDAIDSIITPKTDTTGCLSQGPNCCSIDLVNWQIVPQDVCYFREKPTEECVAVTSGGGLFTFEQHPLMILTSTPTLTLNNCVFKNFMYEFNSFIDMNDLGGEVKIQNTVFSHFNTCGAIVRNKKAIFSRTDLPLNSFPNVYQTRVNNYQGQLYQTSLNELGSFNPYTSCSKDLSISTNTCFGVNINGSRFEHFGSFKEATSAPVWVNPQYKLSYYGQILDLDQFKGHIFVFQSSFYNNTLKFTDCDVGRQIKNNIKTGFVDRFPGLGQKAAIQMKGLITLIGHDRRIDIYENDFTMNSATKGLIFLDVRNRLTYSQRFIIGRNTFEQNFAYYHANLIFVRGRGNQGQNIFTSIPDSDSQSYCTGYLFERNTFNNNAGCPLYSGGILHMQCNNFDDMPLFANDTFPTTSITGNKDAYLGMSFTYQGPTTTVTLNGKIYPLDYRTVQFRYNQYKYNTASGGFALIDIKMIPRLNISHEYITYSGDSSKEFVDYASPQVYTATSSLATISDMMKNMGLYPGYLLSQGIMKIAQTQWVDIKNLTFQYSFVIETSYDSKRSNLMNFQQFYGRLNMDRFNFLYQLSVIGSFTISTLQAAVIFQDDRQYGFGYPLMRFNKDDRVDVNFTSTISSSTSFGKSQIYYAYYVNQSYNEFNIFPNFSDPNGIYAKNVNFTNMDINYYQCFFCKQPTFEFSSDVVYFDTHEYHDFNMFKTSQKYLSLAPLFMFRVKKPYYNSQSVLVTSTVTIIKIRFYEIQYEAGGRIWDFEYSPSASEIEPTTAQVDISGIYNSYDLDTYGNGPLMRLNLNSIQVNFYSSTFTDIGAGFNNTLKAFAGAILVESVGSLTLDQINVKNMFAYQTTPLNGGGRFLYYNGNQTMNLIVQNSVFTCYDSYTTDTTVKTIISQGKYDQGSVFQINSQNQYFQGYFINNTFTDCPRAHLGGAFSIYGNNKKVNQVTFISNTFTNNHALYGGAIYCEYCLIDQFYNNSFKTGYALQGGDLYIVNQVNKTLTLDSNQFLQSSVLATQPGGSIMIIDNITTASQGFGLLMKSSNSESIIQGYFQKIQASHGAVLAINTTRSVDLTFQNIQFLQNTATSTLIASGLININFTDQIQSQSNSQLSANIAFQNCEITNSSGIGGTILEIPNKVNSSHIIIENSILNNNQGTSIAGGAFRLLASYSNLVEMIGGSIQNSASGGNGSAFYMVGIHNTLKLSQNSLISYSMGGNNNGGFVYMEGLNEGNQTLFFNMMESYGTYSSQNGGFAYMKGNNVEVTIVNETKINQASSQLDGGLIYVEATQNANISIFNSTIYNSQSQSGNGGLLYISAKNYSLITIQNSTLQNVQAYNSGGTIYINKGGSSSQVNVQDHTKVKQSSSYQGSGGFIHNEASKQSYNFNLANISYLSTGSDGGILNSIVDSEFALSLQNTNFTGFFAQNLGQFLNLSISDSNENPSSIISTINIINSTLNQSEIDIWNDFPNNYNSIVALLGQGSYLNSVAFNIKNGLTTTIFSQQNSFNNIYVSNKGSLFHLTNSITFTDYNSTFSQLASVLGGVIYCDGCQANFTGSIFNDILAQNGGIIYAMGSSQIYMDAIKVNNVKSFGSGGLVYVYQESGTTTLSSTLSITNCQQKLQNIQASEQGGLIYSSHSGLNLILQNSLIQHINAGLYGGLLYLDQVKSLTFEGLVIKNVSSQEGSVIYSHQNPIDMDISNSQITCSEIALSQDQAIQQFQNKNYNLKGSLFDIQNAESFNSLNNNFKNCYLARNGSIFNLENLSKFYDENSSFDSNAAINGGALHLNNVTIAEFNLTQFKNNLAEYGGSIMQSEDVQIFLRDIIIDQTTSYRDGGFIHTYSSSDGQSGSLQSISIVGENNYISNCQSINGNGGCFYLDSQNINLIITQKMKIENVQAGISGGFIYSSASKKLYLQNLMINQAKSSVIGGAVLYSNYQNTEIQLSNLIINCQSLTQAFTENGAVFHILNSEKEIKASNLTVQYCQNSQFGGVYYLENTKLIDSDNSKYSFNNAMEGGVIYCKNCSVTQSDVIFNNNQAFNGGIYYSLGSTNISISNVVAKNQFANSSASILYATRTKSVEIYESNLVISGTFELDNNSASQNGGCFYFDNPSYNTQINWNQKSRRMMSLLPQNQFTITNSYSINGSGGVFYILSAGKLYMKQGIISEISTATNMNGSFIYSQATELDLQIYESQISCKSVVDNSSFDQNLIQSGGAVYIQDSEFDVQTSNLLIQNCKNSINGGAFSLIRSSLKDSGSTIYSNSALNGGAIFCDDCQLSLIDTNFTSNQAFQGGSLYFQTTIQEIYLEGITISKSRAIGQYSSGGSIYLQGNEDQNPKTLQVLTISNITINDTQSDSNGGFMTINFPGLILTINNVNVSQSAAKNQGGVFFVQNLKQLTISSPSQFKNFSSLSAGQLLKSIANNAQFIIQDVQATCKIQESDLNTQTALSSLLSAERVGSVFEIINADQVQLESFKLHNCFKAINGGVYNLQNVKVFTDQYSTYSNIIAVNGGIGYIENSDVSFSHGIFTNIFANQAGGFYLKDYTPIKIQNCTYTNFYAKTTGGFIQTYQSDSFLSPSSTNYKTMETYDISIKISTFNNFKVGTFGGVFYLDSYYLSNIYLIDVNFDQITSGEHGGVFYITKARNLLSISTSTLFTKNVFSQLQSEQQSSQGSFLYSTCDQIKISVTNTIVECSQKFYDQINSQVIKNGISQNAVAFLIKHAIDIQSSSNVFRYCFGSNKGSVFNLEMTQFNDQNSEFYYNSAIQGGVFYSTSAKINLKGTLINKNQAQRGGVFYQTDNTTVIANNVKLTNNLAILQGGVLFSKNLQTTEVLKCSYQFNNTIISDCAATEGMGGMAYLDNTQASLYIINSEITNINANVKAGLIYALNVQDISFTKTKISNIQSIDVALIYSTASKLKLSISGSEIVCNPTQTSEDLDEYLNSTMPSYTQTSTIDILNAVNISVSKSSFSKCGVSENGGIFYLQQTRFYDSESSYFENYAGFGGVIKLVDGYINIQKSQFFDNYASKGGVIFMSTDSELVITGSKFYQNQAYKDAGVIYLETGSFGTITDSEFYQNSAYENSVLQILEGSKLKNITLDYCSIYQNSAQRNTISVIEGDLTIKDSNFNKNQAYEKTKNIFAGFSNLFIHNTVFRGTGQNIDSLSKEETLGSFIFVILDVNLLIQKSYFQGGFAKQGGAIYISGDAQVQIQSSQFSENKAFQKGGAIYGSGFKAINITDDSRLTNNVALDQGDEIYVANTNGMLNLQDVYISNPNSFLSIYADSVALIMNKTTMTDISTKNTIHDYGSALWCTDCRSILITNSYFKNTRSNIGGIFYIEESFQNKLLSDKAGKYLIKNSHFNNSISNSGGALYLSNIQFMTIENCIFYNNTANNISSINEETYQGSGGAIYYDCDSQLLKCQLSILGKTQFIKNKADRQGGAIHWEQLEPIFSDFVSFNNNSAHQYGNDLSCFAQRISIIDEAQYSETLSRLGMTSRLRNLQEVFTFSVPTNQTNDKLTLNSQRSGGTIPEMYLSLVDKYGQIVSTDSLSKVRVNINPIYTSNSKATTYPPVIEGSTQFLVLGGVVQVNQIQFTGTPGQEYGLVFTTDGIDVKKKSNNEYLDSLKQSDIDFKMDVQLRDCDIGEQFTITGKCQQCQDGTSFSLVQMTEPGNCISCPSDKANCYGGSNVGPKPGYWRKNNVTSNFVKCQYQDACLGMIPPENNPQGSCFQGYQGIICSDCKVGYSRSSDFKCSFCPEKSVNIVRLIFIFLGVLFFIVLLVRQTLNGAKDVKNVTSIYIKIMTNHLQLILLTASFNFDWPQMVQEFFQAIKPVAQVSQQLFSFDCFIDTRKDSNDQETSNDTFRIFYQKLVMLAVFPILLLLFCQGFWAIHHRIMSLKVPPWNKIISTLVILLFLVHPNIVQYMFSNFKCIEIDGENRILDDLQVICWDSTHKIVSYFIALPCIIVWGLGIPFFALVLLMRNRKRLDQIEIRQKLGFLYRGYRKEYHFWEIVIMYRKIILIFVSVFLSTYGVIAQALIVFIILIVFLTFNLKASPFSTLELNDLETLSLISSLITIYCGLFFLSNTKQSLIDVDPDLKSKALQMNQQTLMFLFFMIVISNLLFLIYWTIKILKEIRLKLITKLPKLYLWLCLCNNHEAFIVAKEKLHILDENETLREQFLKQINNVIKLQKNGKIILNKSNIEKFQLLLDQNSIIQLMKNPGDNKIDNYQAKALRRSQRVVNFKSKISLHDEIKKAHLKKIDQSATEYGLLGSNNTSTYTSQLNDKDSKKFDENQFSEDYSSEFIQIDDTGFYDYQKKTNNLKLEKMYQNDEVTRRSMRIANSEYDFNNQSERGSNYNLVDTTSQNTSYRNSNIDWRVKFQKQLHQIQTQRASNFKRTKTTKDVKRMKSNKKSFGDLVKQSTEIFSEASSPVNQSNQGTSPLLSLRNRNPFSYGTARSSFNNNETSIMYDTINKLMINNISNNDISQREQTQFSKFRQLIPAKIKPVQDLDQFEIQEEVFNENRNDSEVFDNDETFTNASDRLQIPYQSGNSPIKKDKDDYIYGYPTLNDKVASFFSKEIKDNLEQEQKYADLAKKKETMMKMEKQDTAIYIQQRGNRDHSRKRQRQQYLRNSKSLHKSMHQISGRSSIGYQSSRTNSKGLLQSIGGIDYQDKQPQNQSYYQRSTLQTKVKDKMRESLSRNTAINMFNKYEDPYEMIQVDIKNDEFVDEQKHETSSLSNEEQSDSDNQYNRQTKRRPQKIDFYDKVHPDMSVNNMSQYQAVEEVKERFKGKKKEKYVIDEDDNSYINRDIEDKNQILEDLLGSIDSQESQFIKKTHGLVIFDDKKDEDNQSEKVAQKQLNSLKVIMRNQNKQASLSVLSKPKDNESKDLRRKKQSRLNLDLEKGQILFTPAFQKEIQEQSPNKQQLDINQDNNQELQLKQSQERLNIKRNEKQKFNNSIQQEQQKSQNNEIKIIKQDTQFSEINPKIDQYLDQQDFEQLMDDKIKLKSLDKIQLKDQLLQSLHIDGDLPFSSFQTSNDQFLSISQPLNSENFKNINSQGEQIRGNIMSYQSQTDKYFKGDLNLELEDQSISEIDFNYTFLQNQQLQAFGTKDQSQKLQEKQEKTQFKTQIQQRSQESHKDNEIENIHDLDPNYDNQLHSHVLSSDDQNWQNLQQNIKSQDNDKNMNISLIEGINEKELDKQSDDSIDSEQRYQANNSQFNQNPTVGFILDSREIAEKFNNTSKPKKKNIDENKSNILDSRNYIEKNNQ
eukprot:403344080